MMDPSLFLLQAMNNDLRQQLFRAREEIAALKRSYEILSKHCAAETERLREAELELRGYANTEPE